MEDLENLLFFNPQQINIQNKIIEMVEKYGSPSIVKRQDQLRIILENVPEVQSLFAFEMGEESKKLIGVMVYLRQNTETLLVIHLGVHDTYSTSGLNADKVLIIQFMSQLKRIARNIKGIQKIILLYGKGNKSTIPV